ncbi:CPBP family intramembrane metalloprotease [Alicyclobacillus cycloheptanicus]|uniref:Membrane protease YdiL (CAAX protease family) n=1 Tax=Alicyclobacillus cycloheptanicus TaxID=1457 RepID=A0ABT9XLT2_9BACL|nr:CPBP family intramembrane glutamic endopeptidase [Alicyclobacillus cycloheptanicus]MDQ0191272.1 membrane protease YdiL (CAAX protease family) [Alicyclobacillus cycloheptanicus]WDM00452.1 CPBP family intramembrane metalloprotease [Alicyclobacillus cycloheptanicus]
MTESVTQQLLYFIAGCTTGGILIGIITVVLRLLGVIRIQPLHNGVAAGISKQERFVTNPFWLLLFAVLEEAFARAFLIGWVGHYTGMVIAFAISAVVFAVLHIPNGRPTVISMLNLGLVTIVFGLVYLQFGLVAAIGVHYGWNLMQWPILGYPMYGRQVGRWLSTRATGPEWVSGGEFGPEYSVVASVLLGICIVVLFLFA